MDIFGNLALGFGVALSLSNLLYCFVGVLLGTFIGVLPGIGPVVTIAVLLPVTFGLPPEGALIMLAGIYYGAAYGGSTTAILVNLPGESSSVVTCLDGYQMARNGRAGPALAAAALSSFLAGCVGTLLIALFGPVLGDVALRFGPAEYASLTIMALVATAALVQGSLLSGILMALLGILFGLVGNDVNSGASRFTFGVSGLADGIDFPIIAMGVFAFAEIIVNLERLVQQEVFTHRIGSLWPSGDDVRRAWKPALRGTAIGSVVGIVPGAGMSISSFAAYVLEKKVSREPTRFGHGAIEGVAAPEAANNAAAQTSFIPTLTLGVPGSPTMALMLGAMMIQGITPGPDVMNQRPTLFWGLIASMWVGNFMLVLLNLPLVGLWVSMLKIPYRWLYPAILIFSCVGVFAISNSVFGVLLAAGLGVLGYAFLKLGCEIAPFILGFILGPMLEEHFRRALLISRGDLTVFVTEPLSAAFLAAAVVLILLTCSPRLRKQKEVAVTAA